MTPEQAAAHRLMLACRRLNTAIESRDEHRAEAARSEVVKKMATLLDEFGVTEVAARVAESLPEFDGRHIEED